MQKLMLIDASKGFNAVALTILLWCAIGSIVIWVVVGLATLRFEVNADYWALLNSNLLLLSAVAIVLVNSWTIYSSGVGRPNAWQWAQHLAAVSAFIGALGAILLMIHLWVDFERGPGWLLRLTFTLFGLGLCGTYAGLVSLAVIDRMYRALIWLIYALTIIVGVEILDGLWLRAPAGASVPEIGSEFTRVGVVVAVALGAYSVLALLLAQMGSRGIALAIYAVSGVIGYTIGVIILWDSIDAGAVRFIMGAALVLSIATSALAMLHYFHKTPEKQTPPKIFGDESEQSEQAQPSGEQPPEWFNKPTD